MSYVVHPGEVVMSPPFSLEGVRMTAIGFRARRLALQAVLDRSFARNDAGIRMVAIAPVVVLVAAFAARARSLAQPEMGWTPEVDVAFWIPAVCMGRGTPRLVWHLPYVYVDSLPACAAGREIFGFPKQMAEIEADHGPGGLRRLRVAAPVLEEGAVVTRTLMKVEKTSEGSGDLPSWLTPQQGAELVFLKQFRDVRQPQRACYQAIVTAPTQATRIRQVVPLTGSYQAQWSAWSNQPFVEDLGLQGENSLFASYVDFDFVLNPGEVWWEAGSRE